MLWCPEVPITQAEHHLPGTFVKTTTPGVPRTRSLCPNKSVRLLPNSMPNLVDHSAEEIAREMSSQKMPNSQNALIQTSPRTPTTGQEGPDDLSAIVQEEQNMRTPCLHHDGPSVAPTPGLDLGEETGSVALSQRNAWKRHQYLQACFEYHLKARRRLTEARWQANQDLMAKFGATAGYSEQQLEDILLDDSPE